MWLLNAKTHRLQRFNDDDVPPYAILSHTWGDEEVSFQDIKDLEVARRIEGYQKIELTCKQALEDGYEYAWVDTCCIDKKSSAELSEAINSMWTYYRESDVCYVFLTDLETGSEEMVGKDDADQIITRDEAAKMDEKVEAEGFQLDVEVKSDDEIEREGTIKVDVEALGQCRWFERGWTLQELIAPETVRFYDSNWTVIGTKSSLASHLAEMTGINIAVLQEPSAFKKYSIAQKMSWAAGRETTRSEDIAYSLLGLFEVNMPLLYGEGTSAFTRLQQEIIRNSSDQSIFLWQAYWSDGTFGVLAPSPDEFFDAGKMVSMRSWIRSSELENSLEKDPSGFEPSAAYRPYELVNAGLRISLPIIETSWTTYLVFRCRYADDFSGPLAMEVSPRTPAQGTEEPCFVVNYNHKITRLADIYGEVIGGRLGSCILLDSRMRGGVASSTNRYTTLWCRPNAAFADNFVVSQAYPEENWNPDTGVMQWSKGEDWDSSTSWARANSGMTRSPVLESKPWGFISWKRRDLEWSFFATLIFKAFKEPSSKMSWAMATVYTDREIGEAECRVLADALVAPKAGVRLEHLSMGSAPWFQKGLVEYPGPERLSFEVGEEKIFDEHVWFVDIALEDAKKAWWRGVLQLLQELWQSLWTRWRSLMQWLLTRVRRQTRASNTTGLGMMKKML